MAGQEYLKPTLTITAENLTGKAKSFVKNCGACAVGITTVETLAGGPPSTNLEYVLPGAKSAVTFAMPLDQDKIRNYLAKEDRDAHQVNYNDTNSLATGVASQLASFFREFGFDAVGVQANQVYRNDDDSVPWEYRPDLSHRLLAVRGGVGWFGLSGNVLTAEYGANAALCTMVTTAELGPTEPLPPEENYCDCTSMECVAACPSGFLRDAKRRRVTVTMGGQSFTYGERARYERCIYVCAGFTGLHPSGRWSTWSPGRFPIPKKDEDLKRASEWAFRAWAERPYMDGHTLQAPLLYAATGKDAQLSCGGCMLVCTPDKEERARRLKTLQSSGVVIQHPDGAMEAVSPQQAQHHLGGLDDQARALYEPEDPEIYKDMEIMGGDDRR
jgi:epoxyqueuosine reductase QueG